jgi:hypothetical protein
VEIRVILSSFAVNRNEDFPSIFAVGLTTFDVIGAVQVHFM